MCARSGASESDGAKQYSGVCVVVDMRTESCLGYLTKLHHFCFSSDYRNIQQQQMCNIDNKIHVFLFPISAVNFRISSLLRNCTSCTRFFSSASRRSFSMAPTWSPRRFMALYMISLVR